MKRRLIDCSVETGKEIELKAGTKCYAKDLKLFPIMKVDKCWINCLSVKIIKKIIQFNSNKVKKKIFQQLELLEEKKNYFMN